MVLAGSLLAGLLAAVALVAGPFAGDREAAITGALLLGIAVHFVANTRWWPPFCAVVDWVVAAIIVGEIARRRRSAGHRGVKPPGADECAAPEALASAANRRGSRGRWPPQ
jgi:hypothetical protein